MGELRICFIITILLFSVYNGFAQDTILINNKTEQVITQLDYWLGSETEANNPGLVYKSKGTIDSGDHNFRFTEDFHKKKRNKIIVKAYLKGGGFTSVPYSISKKQSLAPIIIRNPASEVPKDDFQRVLDKFGEFNFDDEYIKLTSKNALLSTLGAIYIYDSEEKTLLYVITPKELGSEMTEICKHDNEDIARGTFSSSTAISGDISLPFVSINSAFSSGDVCKFVWKIDNTGECVWSPSNNKELATLFSELSKDTKDALIQIYEKHPNAKLKFINKVFLIGRIEVETEKSKRVNNNTDLTGSSFVTAKGNYTFEDAFSTRKVINDVVTKADGYYATGLLANLYVLTVAQAKKIATQEQNERVQKEFSYLLKKYPNLLTETDDVSIMKKQIVDLNKMTGGVIYLNKKEGDATVELQEVTEQNKSVGDIKSINSTD